MKTEDNSQLSAYLDGELDSESRARVESELLADPKLAERYRELALVHDLVSNLSRPVLSGSIVDEVVTHVSQPHVRLFGRRMLALAPVGFGLSAAAALLLMLNLGRPPRPAPVVEKESATASLVAQPTRAPSDEKSLVPVPIPTSEAAPPTLAAVNPPATGSSPSPPAHHEQPGNPELPLQADNEQQTIRDMLDSPNLNRIFLVVDEFEGNLPNQVEDLVKNTPRIDPTFGRLTVSQGIVIDPNHPNQATVFTLVMDQSEVDRFRNQLNQGFPQKVEEMAPNPAIVTALSEIGQVKVLEGTRATELAATPNPNERSPRNAIKAGPRTKKRIVVPSPEFDNLRVVVVDQPPPLSQEGSEGANSSSATPPTTPASRSRRPTGESTPEPSLAQQDLETGEEPREPKPSSPSVVLVWVTSKNAARPIHH